MNRFLVLLAVLSLSACTASDDTGAATSRSPTLRRTASFSFVGSPPPASTRCPTPPRQPGYRVQIEPKTASVGSRIELTGNTPLFVESGRYVGPTGKIGFWFNLPYDEWVETYSSIPPPTANGGVPVIHLGEMRVEGLCSYTVTIGVPDVAAGRYRIVPIEHGHGGSAAMSPIWLRIDA